ncbi:hypothetical protein Vadar_003520 [Vaccinium darrowii]|uniref:Uncharacterized protein n=1 Tax=Vaccinium darrowii TaxID=229202 RepID=A0ACB7XXV8_9ERIC|nr:hypothetical protein Vadar_003520 [Vaccinium darrowii]
MASGSSKRARAASIEIQAASCQVDGCQADLSGRTEDHRRHKVCRRHSKTPEVEIRGHKQRFCRQCSRDIVLGRGSNCICKCHTDRKTMAAVEIVVVVDWLEGGEREVVLDQWEGGGRREMVVSGWEKG